MTDFETEMPRTSDATRRSVLKAAAWTAPVIALSVAAPAASASLAAVASSSIALGSGITGAPTVNSVKAYPAASGSGVSVFNWTGTAADGTANSNTVSWTDATYSAAKAVQTTGNMTYTVTFANNPSAGIMNTGTSSRRGTITLMEPWKLPSASASAGSSLTSIPTGAVKLDTQSPNNTITADVDGKIWYVMAITNPDYSNGGINAFCTVVFRASAYTITSKNSVIYLPRVGFRTTYTLQGATDSIFYFYSSWNGDTAAPGKQGLSRTSAGPI